MQGSILSAVNSDLCNSATNDSACTCCNLCGRVDVTTTQITLHILRGNVDILPGKFKRRAQGYA